MADATGAIVGLVPVALATGIAMKATTMMNPKTKTSRPSKHRRHR